MKKNKLKSLTSFFDEDKKQNRCDEGESTLSADEKKLLFFWDKCSLEDLPELNILEKTNKKIANISKKSSFTDKGRRIKLQWLITSAAASLLFLIGITYFYQNIEERMDITEFSVALQDAEEQEDLKEITLIVADEKKIALSNHSKVVYSANGQTNVDLYPVKESAKEDNLYDQIIVPKGKRSQIILSDNSQIWINSESRVVYPRSFKGKYREIYVEGEVFLKVSHNAEKPFVVNTSGFEVKVLGTSFNVSARRGEKGAAVVLVEGAVEIEDDANHHIKMSPNEMVSLSENIILDKEIVNVSNYISWINGVWIMKGELLKDVADKLEEYYGQKILLNNSSIGYEQVYGKLYLDENIDSVLQSIATVLHLKTIEKDGQYYIDRM